MADLVAFLRWVLPYAVACPEPIAEAHVRDAVRDFCASTRCWRRVQTTVLVGTETEIIVAPAGANLHELEDASFNDKPLTPVAYDDATFDYPVEPYQITQINPTSFVLAPKFWPGTVKISAFMKPSQAAIDVPDFILDQYGQHIGHGALSTILAIPEQPFSNPQMAGYYRQLFQDAKDANFNANRRGQQRARTRTRPQFM
jgi:hypothetical protein